jgi:hypothetical protein
VRRCSGCPEDIKTATNVRQESRFPDLEPGRSGSEVGVGALVMTSIGALVMTSIGALVMTSIGNTLDSGRRHRKEQKAANRDIRTLCSD